MADIEGQTAIVTGGSSGIGAASAAMAESRGYRPIADYAVVGDCHGCALIARDGGVDWCCFRRFDADPLLSRLLDEGKGGFLSVAVEGALDSSRAYIEGTNILRTDIRASTGRLEVVDFMPLGRAPDAGPNDYVSVAAPGWFVRRIEVLEGEVTVEMRFAAAKDFSGKARLERTDDGIRIDGSGHLLRSDMEWSAAGHESVARATLSAGSRRYLVLAPDAHRVDAARVDQLLAVTQAFWREWIAYCRYRGPHQALVERSALVLKLMTYPPNGTCVAAMTTSLPEWIGGERNWDYRFCWIRDASLMLHALSELGYSGESGAFFSFLCEKLAEGVENLQLMYGVGGEKTLDERQLDELDGYMSSRPVRVGNAAHEQRQIDLYGYVLEGALVYRELGGKLSAQDSEALALVVDFIEECWKLPDTGIWEVRGPPRHFVHSKAMCWVVVDRAIRLFGPRAAWVALRDRIREEILRRGRDPEHGHLLQYYDAGPEQVDAALLQLSGLGMDLDPATLRATRLAIERELREGDYLQRYRSEDGLRGPDGAFLVCSFWHVDALLCEGEAAEATALFERLAACANDVGLYAEEIEPSSRAFLGNFPQAFTHLGCVNTAVNFELFRRHGAAAVREGYADRARRSVKAAFGWKGVAAAFFSTGHVRVLSSRASKLDLRELAPGALARAPASPAM